MRATIKSVFVRDPSEPVELGETKETAPTLDGYRFHLSPRIQAAIELSPDPSDGQKRTLLLSMWVDGTEVMYVTDWISNTDKQRVRDYAFEVPGYEKFMSPGKAHRVEIKLGERKLLQWFRAREYNLFESELYYYRVGPLPG